MTPASLPPHPEKSETAFIAPNLTVDEFNQLAIRHRFTQR
jgi:hypothetical protein